MALSPGPVYHTCPAANQTRPLPRRQLTLANIICTIKTSLKDGLFENTKRLF